MNGVAMNTFTIDATQNITAFASLEEARSAKINNAEYFGSAQELAKLAASWPARRPVEIWNSFAGVAPFTSLKPVKKFPNRKAAVAEIWKALQALSASAAKQAAPAPPAKGKPKKNTPTGKRRRTPRVAERETTNVAREGSKKAEVIDLIRRQRIYARRNHGTDRLASTHRARLRQRDADQEAGVESRVLPFDASCSTRQPVSASWFPRSCSAPTGPPPARLGKEQVNDPLRAANVVISPEDLAKAFCYGGHRPMLVTLNVYNSSGRPLAFRHADSLQSFARIFALVLSDVRPIGNPRGAKGFGSTVPILRANF